MRKGASFFVLGVLLFGLMLSNQVFGASENQITVSATVLEHLTYIKNDSKTDIYTNAQYETFITDKYGLKIMSLNY